MVWLTCEQSWSNIYHPLTVAGPFFQLWISHAAFFFFSVPATGFSGILLSRQNDKSTLRKQTFFFFFLYLDHHLHHTWNYSAGPVWEMGSKSTEKHEITEMYFFSLSLLPSQPLHLQITFVPLTLYASSTFHPTLRLTRGSFLFLSLPFSPSSPLALSL